MTKVTAATQEVSMGRAGESGDVCGWTEDW